MDQSSRCVVQTQRRRQARLHDRDGDSARGMDRVGILRVGCGEMCPETHSRRRVQISPLRRYL